MASSTTEIQSATVARGVDKVTHETFYVVKSDSSETTWYTVRWNNERLMWCCNCPARCSGCKHSRAIAKVQVLRRAAEARMQADEDRRLAVRDKDTRQAEASHRPSQKGTLSSNRGFSLLK